MHEDPIVEEIRAIRHKLAAKFDNNLDRILADLRRREKESGRNYVTLPKRPVNTNLILQTDTVSENQPTQPSK